MRQQKVRKNQSKQSLLQLSVEELERRYNPSPFSSTCHRKRWPGFGTPNPGCCAINPDIAGDGLERPLDAQHPGSTNPGMSTG